MCAYVHIHVCVYRRLQETSSTVQEEVKLLVQEDGTEQKPFAANVRQIEPFKSISGRQGSEQQSGTLLRLVCNPLYAIRP